MPLFSPEFYDKLDASYRAIFQPFVEKFENKEHLYSDQDEITDFLSKYMVPQEIKNKFWSNDSDETPIAFYWFTISRVLLEESDFMYSYKLMSLDTEQNSCYDDPWLLTFPNYNLDEILDNCEQKSDKLLPKKYYKKYDEMKLLYDEIMTVDKGDEEKWIETLWKTKDIDFVMDNVEIRLGNEITNRKLWKLYIDFLEKYDDDILLQTFSKYCRFFMDDHEMMSRYEKAAKSLGKKGLIRVPWTNPFPFEQHCDTIAQELFDQHLDMIVPKFHQEYMKRPRAKSQQPSHLFSSSEFYSEQYFAFSTPTINYIFQNSDFYLRKKLLFSCQLFFLLFPHPLCYKFKICRRSLVKHIAEDSWTAHLDSDGDDWNFNDFHITTIFSVESDKYSPQFSPTTVSEILPYIYKCDARQVKINAKQCLKFTELKFLIGSGNVENLFLGNVKCTHESGEEVPMDDVLKMTPKIKFFDICKATLTKQTAKNLVEIPFQNKIHRMRFISKINELEPYAFAEFVKKNTSNNCQIYYNTGSHPSGGPNFDEILKNAIEVHWKGVQEKPHICQQGFEGHYMRYETEDW